RREENVEEDSGEKRMDRVRAEDFEDPGNEKWINRRAPGGRAGVFAEGRAESVADGDRECDVAGLVKERHGAQCLGWDSLGLLPEESEAQTERDDQNDREGQGQSFQSARHSPARR